jgi:inhibitor of KinA
MTGPVPLGDQAALAYFDAEAHALRFAAVARQSNDPWLVDVVSAYKSVAVYFDLLKTDFATVANRFRELWRHVSNLPTNDSLETRRHEIPCCYELQLDLPRVAQHTGCSVDEIIGLHTGTDFTVYAIGFCPGFPYLGYLPEKLAGVPRLESPRVRVEAGSVGLTGRQTGIYTEPRPGGWNLIGRTPLELVNVADGYFPLRTGDRVRFVRIDEVEYGRRRGERLSIDQG